MTCDFMTNFWRVNQTGCATCEGLKLKWEVLHTLPFAREACCTDQRQNFDCICPWGGGAFNPSKMVDPTKGLDCNGLVTMFTNTYGLTECSNAKDFLSWIPLDDKNRSKGPLLPAVVQACCDGGSSGICNAQSSVIDSGTAPLVNKLDTEGWVVSKQTH
jgi:hypothetical protein